MHSVHNYIKSLREALFKDTFQVSYHVTVGFGCPKARHLKWAGTPKDMTRSLDSGSTIWAGKSLALSTARVS